MLLVVRERSSRVSIAFLTLVVTAAHWLLSLSFVYRASDASHALFWSRIAYLGIPFIAAAIFTFSAVLLNQTTPSRRHLIIVWGGSLFFSLLISGTNLILGGVYRYSWGYYPKLTPWSFVYLAFFGATLLTSLRMFIVAQRNLQSETEKKRAAAFLRALAFGYVGLVDYLPSYGIPVYPFGFIAVAIFLALAARAAWRYHLIDLTPALAAAQILETMQGAVVVTDIDQRIRLVNQAATALLQRSITELNGLNIRNILVSESTALPSDTVVRGEQVRDRVMTWRTASGRAIEVAVSGAPLRDARGVIVGSVYVALDITPMREAERSIERLSRQNQLLLEAAGEGIHGLDSKGLTTFLNPAAQHMLGWSADELLGEPHHTRVHYRRADGTAYPRESCPIERSITEARTISASDDLFFRRDGSSFPVEYISTPLFENGVLVGAVVTFNDISARKEADEQREVLIRQQEAMRAKDELLANVTHDLRSPVTAIQGWVDLLSGPEPAPSLLAEGLAAIQQAATMQRQLIEDLLESSRISDGAQMLDAAPVDLQAVVASVVAVLQPIAADKKIAISLGSKEGALTVRADEPRLRQIVWNLLSNAIKFTQSGGAIRIEIEQDGGNGRVTITDNGRGISPQFLPHVFDRHRQEHPTRASGGGFGLGLAIVRHLVELHGGEVRASSEGPGLGASFTFTIPRV